MITEEYYKSIGLTGLQIKAITKAMEDEERFKSVLRRAGVVPNAIDKITAKSDTSIINEIGEVALLEIVKEEWSGFIPKKKKG